MNETLRQTEECRVQCEVASQRLPEDRGVNSVDGVFEKAAGKENTCNLDIFSLNRKNKDPKRPFFSLLCSSIPLTARMSAVLCDSGGHKARENFFSGGLPADTAGASAYCTIQR